MTYQSLLTEHNVTSVGLLKLDTEGFDAAILAQVLRWGTSTGGWPERIQFERNNLTDLTAAGPTFEALLTMYDCWIVRLEDDVHCMRLRGLAFGNPAQSTVLHGRSAHFAVIGGSDTCSATQEEEAPWWNQELAARVTVVGVHVATCTPCSSESFASWEVRVGDHADPRKNAPCAPVRSAMAVGGLAAVHCGRAGRHFGVTMPRGSLVLCRGDAYGVVAPRGSWRMSVGRQCCHGGCTAPRHLFDGYDPHCEARCLANPRCLFFTIYSSLWCSLSASCAEDMASASSAVTFIALDRP